MKLSICCISLLLTLVFSAHATTNVERELIASIRNGDLLTAQTLIVQNAKTMDMYQPIMNAAFYGHLPIVKLIEELPRLENLNTSERTQFCPQDTCFDSAMAAAVAGNNFDIFMYLAEAGEPVDKQIFDVAYRLEDPTIALFLVDHVADISILKDENGQSPIVYAASCAQIKVFERLNERKDVIEMTNLVDCTSALVQAAANNMVDNVEYLISWEYQVRPNAFIFVNREPALLKAVENNHLEVVRVLLNRGAEHGRKLFSSLTLPLMKAVDRNLIPICKELIKAGDLAYYKDWQGRTLLMCAAIHGHLSLIKYLNGVDTHIDMIDRNGFTALMLATATQNLEAVQLLLDLGASTVIKTYDQDTVLTIAVEKGNHKLCQLLLENHAIVNALDNQDKIPLILAVQSGSELIVRELLKYKPNLKLRDSRRNTALIWAANLGQSNIVELLVEYGASLKFKDCRRIPTKNQEQAPSIQKLMTNCPSNLYARMRHYAMALIKRYRK